MFINVLTNFLFLFIKKVLKKHYLKACKAL